MGNGCFYGCKKKRTEEIAQEETFINRNPNDQLSAKSNVQLEIVSHDFNQRKHSKKSLHSLNSRSMKPGKKFSLTSIHTIHSNINSNICIDSDDFISIHDLYNMLNDGGMRPYIQDPFNMLLIDGRDLNDFVADHIITAKHFTKITKNSNFLMRLHSYAMLIIYGYEIKDDRETQQLVDIRTEIQEYVAGDILVLREGFDVFKNMYQFLCTDKEIETIADRKNLVCYPSVIIDNKLFQGRGDQATNESIVKLLKITHIVNITMEHKNAFPELVKYLKLSLDDMGDTNLFEHFSETSEFIEEAIKSGGCVLVHCNQGVSRSSSITLAYMMKYRNVNLQTAFNTLKARRSCAFPNYGFLNQLSDWEEVLYGKRSTNIDSL